MAVAKAYGVSKIIAFDIDKARVDFAVKHYANVGIVCPMNTEKQEPLAFATEFVDKVIVDEKLKHGVDVTVEATGADACVQMGVLITKAGGTCEFMIFFFIFNF